MLQNIFSAIWLWLYARLTEPTSRAALTSGGLAATTALLSGYGAKGAALAFVGAAGGVLCPELRSVGADIPSPPPSA